MSKNNFSKTLEIGENIKSRYMIFIKMLDFIRL